MISLLLGSDRDTTDSAALAWLTVSSALFMSVMLLQPAMVALRRHRALVLAWVAGTVAFVLSFVLPLPSAVDRGVLAQIASPLVTLAVQLAVLGSYRRSEPAAGVESEVTTPGSKMPSGSPSADG